MGRERWSQVLVLLGLLALGASSVFLGISGQVRNTDVVQAATTDLLAVPSERAAVAGELNAALDRAFPMLPITEAEQAFAVDRMLANGDLIDEVERAFAPGHHAWLDGSALTLDLDPRVVTSVAIAGIRDANPGLVDSLGSQTLVAPEPISMPTWVSAATVNQYWRGAQMMLGAGALVLVFGVVLGFRRRATWRVLGRGLIALGLVSAGVVLLAPLSTVNQGDDRLAVVGALLVPARTIWLAGAVLVVLTGLSLHGRADRFTQASSVDRSRRVRRERAPAKSGGPPPIATRKAGRHRAEAIDAFFEPTEARESESVTVIDLAHLDELDEDSGEDTVFDAADSERSVPTLAGETADDETADEEDGEVEPPAPRELTPEEERAEALANERREALERIDGTRSRYRTHLRR